MRYLILAGVVLLAIILWRRAARGSAAAQGKPAPPAQRIVQCRRCGVYLPEADAVQGDGAYFCTPQHRDEGAEGGV